MSIGLAATIRARVGINGVIIYYYYILLRSTYRACHIIVGLKIMRDITRRGEHPFLP